MDMDKRLAMDRQFLGFRPLASQIGPRLAMDRLPSARTVTEDGHLHVAANRISKADVNPYWGEEIPGFEALGLDPKQKYMLLRDPNELANAAGTFNNKPILAEHIPVSSQKHPSELVIGSTGSDTRYEHPFLKSSLVFWPQPAIDAIQSEGQKELSCAYHYDPDMTPGVYEGKRYDGVMRNIRGNHVALVKDGRAGSEVVVQDAAFDEGRYTMAKLTPAGLVARSALFTYLSPRLTEDSSFDYDRLVRGVTSKNYTAKKSAIELAVHRATTGRLAQDADIQDLANLLDALAPSAEQADAQMGAPPQGPPQGGPPQPQDPNAAIPQAVPQKKPNGMDDEPTDTVAKIKAYLAEEGVSPEILANLDSFLAEGGNPKPKIPDASGGGEGSDPPAGDEDVGALGGPTAIGGIDEDPAACDEDDDDDDMNGEAEDEVVPKEQSGLVTKAAMDAAIKQAQTEAIQTQRQVREAERFVRPWVGELAMDAAHPDEVYRAALKVMGISNATKLHRDALKPILQAQPKASARSSGNGGARPRIAIDSAPEQSFAERFPTAAKVSIQ